MADINQIISWGIGTPADIPHFLNVGLSIGAPLTVVDALADTRMRCASDDVVVVGWSNDVVVIVPEDDGVGNQ